jgi:hypothetical protein
MTRTLDRLRAGWVGFVLAMVPISARASGESSPLDPDTTGRVMTLRNQVIREGERAYTWRAVWFGINGASTVGPLVAAPFVRTELRQDLIAGGVISGVSAVVTLLWPLDVEAYGARLASTLPPTTCQDALQVEKLAAAGARDEAERMRWPWHATNLAVSGALGALIAFGFGHRMSGALTGASSFIVGEAQLLTQPTRLEDDWRAYRSQSGLELDAKPQSAVDVDLTLKWE